MPVIACLTRSRSCGQARTVEQRERKSAKGLEQQFRASGARATEASAASAAATSRHPNLGAADLSGAQKHFTLQHLYRAWHCLIIVAQWPGKPGDLCATAARKHVLFAYESGVVDCCVTSHAFAAGMPRCTGRLTYKDLSYKIYCHPW